MDVHEKRGNIYRLISIITSPEKQHLIRKKCLMYACGRCKNVALILIIK